MNGSALARTVAAVRPRWFILGLVCLCLFVSVSYTLKAMEGRSAIVRFLAQLEHFDNNDEIYERYQYPHPPLMALGLRQIGRLPPVAAALVWFYLKLGLTIVAMLWVFRMVEESGNPFPSWAKALTVLLSIRPIMGDLQHGNINLFILFLVVGFLYAYHRGRDSLAGIILGLAIVCRLTPLLFVPYLIWKKAWTTLLGCVAGLVLFVWIVPALLMGMDENSKMLSSWAEQWIKPYLLQGLVTSEHNNQSLPGLVHRLLTESPSFSTYVNHQYTPLDYHNVLSLDVRIAGWLVKGCMVLFAGLVVWVCRTPTQPRDTWRLAAEFSLIALGMLLFSERTWKHHCVVLILPFAVLCYYLAACQPVRWLRAYLIGTLIASMLLIGSTSNGFLPEVVFGKTAKMAQVYGAYVWAHLLLVAALAVLLCQKDDRQIEPHVA